MIISIDAMSSDRGPEEIVKGACLACQRLNEITKIILVGDERKIIPSIDHRFKNKIEILHTSEFISMDDHPAQAYRTKKEASIILATRLVKEGNADAVISAGSTGAQMVSALFELGRIKGIKRPAISVLLPTLNGYKLLTDAGANTDVEAINLMQFALMGSVYMKILQPEITPKVALINNGVEETKGNMLTQETFKLLKENDLINFIGNIEGREITEGIADVMVCDGFTGNIILKVLEGFGKNIFLMLEKEIRSKYSYQLGAGLLKPAFYQLRDNLDPRKVGGAPLLGVNGISIVCHGNSNAEAICNGVQVAVKCYMNKLTRYIIKSIGNGGPL